MPGRGRGLLHRLGLRGGRLLLGNRRGSRGGWRRRGLHHQGELHRDDEQIPVGVDVKPAAAGLWLGFLFLLALDHIIPHLHWGSAQPEGPSSRLRRTTMMVLAVTLHNIPEGMAVGVVCAGYLAGDTEITAMGVLALSLGIAVQNFPEGAIVSMPLRAEGEGKLRAFAGGVLSGVVEPIGALVTILAAELLVPALPYLLGFAAGAMLYVVVEEMIPEMSQGRHSHIGVLAFAAGFSVMMVLDVALG